MAGRPGQRLHDSEQARLVGGPGRLGCHLRGRCKGRDHAAGGMEVMQAPGASLGETQLHGSGTHESGHPARLNGRSILKRHSRLKLPKSSSGFCTLSVQSSDTSIVDSRESCQNFCPTHPPQQKTAIAVLKSVSLAQARTVGHRRLPMFPRKGSDGLGPTLPQGWVVPLKPHRVRTAGLRPYSAGLGSLG